MAKAIDKKVIRLFLLGWPPSAIDRKLGIDNAHDIIVKHWQDDDIHVCAGGGGLIYIK